MQDSQIIERLLIAREAALDGLANIPSGPLSPGVARALTDLLETVSSFAAMPEAMHVQAALWHLQAAQKVN